MYIRSYIRPDYLLFTLYFALYKMHVPSLTEEIRDADETPTTFSPCIQSSDNIIYE